MAASPKSSSRLSLTTGTTLSSRAQGCFPEALVNEGTKSFRKLRIPEEDNRKYPQYCWEFHDRLWEALSGTTSEKRSAPSRTGGGDNSGNALEASNALNYRVWGTPAVLSTGIPGDALRAFPGSLRNFSGISSGKSQPYWGYGPDKRATTNVRKMVWSFSLRPKGFSQTEVFGFGGWRCGAKFGAKFFAKFSGLFCREKKLQPKIPKTLHSKTGELSGRNFTTRTLANIFLLFSFIVF